MRAGNEPPTQVHGGQSVVRMGRAERKAGTLRVGFVQSSFPNDLQW
jgi:hypothetical protein